MKTIVIANFNSIKVQLELYILISSSNRQRFQFHKGTIRTGDGIELPHEAFISIP